MSLRPSSAASDQRSASMRMSVFSSKVFEAVRPLFEQRIDVLDGAVIVAGIPFGDGHELERVGRAGLRFMSG